MLKPLQSELLNSIPGIRHAFFTRQGGVSAAPFDSLNCLYRGPEITEHAQENRQRITQWFGQDLTLLTPHQVHGGDVLCVQHPFDRDHVPQCDGLVTQQPHNIIGVATADCVPVLLCDPIYKSVAAVHTGWRGTAKNIVQNAVDCIVQQGGSVKNIVAAIGPSIQQQSYLVSREVFDAFVNVSFYYTKFFQTNGDDKFLFNLPGVVYDQLQQAGIGKIDWLKWDTYTNPELFFSCRRNSHQGQQFFGAMLAGIMLEE